MWEIYLFVICLLTKLYAYSFLFSLDYSDISQLEIWTKSGNHPHYHQIFGYFVINILKYGMYRWLYVMWYKYIYSVVRFNMLVIINGKIMSEHISVIGWKYWSCLKLFLESCRGFYVKTSRNAAEIFIKKIISVWVLVIPYTLFRQGTRVRGVTAFVGKRHQL